MKKIILFSLFLVTMAWGQVKLSQTTPITGTISDSTIFAMQSDSSGVWVWRKMTWTTLKTQLVLAGILGGGGTLILNNPDNMTIQTNPDSTISFLGLVQFGANGSISPTASVNTTALQNMINSIDTGVVYINSRGDIKCNTITIPSTIVLSIRKGSTLNVQSGQTLTMNGFIDASPTQRIFTGGGTVLIPNQKVYPEWWGAKGDSVTNDVAAIRSAFNSTTKEIIFAKPIYSVGSKIDINLQGRNLEISSNSNIKIYSSATPVTDNIMTLEGGVHIFNGGVVSISNMTFEGKPNDDTYTPPTLVFHYLNALLVDSCDQVYLNKVTAKNACFSGILIKQVNYFSAIDCNASYNQYAGLNVQNASSGNISGGVYSYNGKQWVESGYGISLGHRNGSFQDNTGITIEKVTANYNLRKGIDVHGGVGIKITHCNVKGFGSGGIYAVNEAGSNPDDPSTLDESWYKYVKDIIISENTIENDSAWFVSHPLDNIFYQANSNAILVGTFANDAFSGGSIILSNNIIRHCNIPLARAPILVFTGVMSSGQHDDISIIGNKIYDAGVSHYYLDGAIFVTGLNPPKNIDISNNFINGAGDSCIAVTIGDNVSISNNQIQGTFQYPIIVDYSIPQRISGNTYNGIPLPDMLSAKQGKIEREVITGETYDTTISIMTVDANLYPQGTSNFTIKITSQDFTNLLNGDFIYYANAYNSALGTCYFNVIKGDATGINYDPDTFTPTISWYPDTGYIRTLNITFHQRWTSHHISVDYQARSLIPYYKGN